MEKYEHPFIQSAKEQWLNNPEMTYDNLETLVADHNARTRPDMKFTNADHPGVLAIGMEQNNQGHYQLVAGILSNASHVETLKSVYPTTLCESYSNLQDSTKLPSLLLEKAAILMGYRDIDGITSTWESSKELAEKQANHYAIIDGSSQILPDAMIEEYKGKIQSFIDHVKHPVPANEDCPKSMQNALSNYHRQERLLIEEMSKTEEELSKFDSGVMDKLSSSILEVYIAAKEYSSELRVNAHVMPIYQKLGEALVTTNQSLSELGYSPITQASRANEELEKITTQLQWILDEAKSRGNDILFENFWIYDPKGESPIHPVQSLSKSDALSNDTRINLQRDLYQ